MARAALGWSSAKLADIVGVDRKTIVRFEKGDTMPRAANAEAVRRVLEEAGVRFAEAGGVYPPR